VSRLLLALLVFAALALGGCSSQDTYAYRGTPYNPVVPAPDIVGVRAGNVPFRLSDLKEKIKMVFFGYTFCPDVCPTTLSNMRSVYKKLNPEDQKRVAMIFVSVDPERDTPEKLAEYVNAFDPAFYGVHVDADPLTALKKAYNVYAEKHVEVGKPMDPVNYFVDHTAAVFLIDKDNKLREIFPNDDPINDYLVDVQHLLSQ
jgi:protein SCO1/2